MRTAPCLYSDNVSFGEKFGVCGRRARHETLGRFAAAGSGGERRGVPGSDAPLPVLTRGLRVRARVQPARDDPTGDAGGGGGASAAAADERGLRDVVSRAHVDGDAELRAAARQALHAVLASQPAAGRRQREQQGA